MLWSQFSAIYDNFRRKNLRFSQKPMLWSQFLHNSALIWVKNANFFAEFFGENIFKIITSVPGMYRKDQNLQNAILSFWRFWSTYLYCKYKYV
jgi:hypothetical protein